MVSLVDEKEQAWTAIHDATSPGGWVGRPGYNDHYCQWEQYAFDPSERAKAGLRSRESTEVGNSELSVPRDMAYCLGEISARRVPK